MPVLQIPVLYLALCRFQGSEPASPLQSLGGGRVSGHAHEHWNMFLISCPVLGKDLAARAVGKGVVMMLSFCEK